MYLLRNLQNHLQGHIGSEKDHLYSTIDREQAGFRPGSSCVDHINTLRIIIEQRAEYCSDLHLLFVDFEKAFDSVDRVGLWMALRRRGISNKLGELLKTLPSGKAARIDGIPAELYKSNPYMAAEVLKPILEEA